jgi:CubicO group peptidase (beta-lactamase class C family)
MNRSSPRPVRTIEAAKLQGLATELAQRLGVPGAQIAVLINGEITEAAIGVASLATGVHVAPDTLFQGGSIAKLLTAALVMQLVDEGRIDLDVPVVGQLPGFRLADPRATAKVSPRHLLAMTSGMDNGPYLDFGRGDDAVARYFETLSDLPCSFQPGAGFSGISNAAAQVSGRLVEHVTGESWDVALKSRFLVPAGLGDSATLPEDVIHRRFAVGHKVAKDGQATATGEQTLVGRSMGPSGSTFYSTASDLVRIAHLFLAEGRSLDARRVLSPAAAQAMQSPQTAMPPIIMADWLGFGPYGKRWNDVDVLGLMGTNTGGGAWFVWSPALKLAVAVTVNMWEGMTRFARPVFEFVFREAAGIEAPPVPPPSADPIENPSVYVGRYEIGGATMEVTRDGDTLLISRESDLDPSYAAPPAPLIPVSPTTFLPSNPWIAYHYGWGITFGGPSDAPTHLFNGFQALRRVTAI